MRQPTFKERPDWWELTTDPHPLKDGLVFAGLGRFPGTTRYHDSSLYGRTGTLQNMDPATDWVPALGRWALDFDGNNDYWLTQSFTGDSGSFSLSAWIFRTSSGASHEILSKGPPTFIVNDVEFLFAIGTGGAVSVYGNAASLLKSTTGVVSLSVFTHLGATWDGTTARVYINGANPETATPVYSHVGKTCALYSGRRCYGGLQFPGIIADTMVWSRALSQPEITALADPSNVMLAVGGNPLLRYRRKWWPVSSGGAVNYYIPNKQRYYRNRRVAI